MISLRSPIVAKITTCLVAFPIESFFQGVRLFLEDKTEPAHKG